MIVCFFCEDAILELCYPMTMGIPQPFSLRKKHKKREEGRRRKEEKENEVGFTWLVFNRNLSITFFNKMKKEKFILDNI